MKANQPCKEHPRYKGVLAPRVDCLPCWKFYAIEMRREKRQVEREFNTVAALQRHWR